MKTVYAVYSQSYPEIKYDPALESLWSTRELAKGAIARLVAHHKSDDWVKFYIQPLHVDSDGLVGVRHINGSEIE